MWCGAKVKVLEERGKKKKTYTQPFPLYYIKWNNASKEKVSYWSAAQSQNSVLNITPSLKTEYKNKTNITLFINSKLKMV